MQGFGEIEHTAQRFRELRDLMRVAGSASPQIREVGGKYALLIGEGIDEEPEAELTLAAARDGPGISSSVFVPIHIRTSISSSKRRAKYAGMPCFTRVHGLGGVGPVQGSRGGVCI